MEPLKPAQTRRSRKVHAPPGARRARAFFYDANGRDRELPLDEVEPKQLRDDNLLWLDVTEPDEEILAHLQEVLNVPGDTLRVPDTVGRPQLHNHGDYYRFAVDSAPGHYEPADNGDDGSASPHPKEQNGSEPGSIRVVFVVAERWIVTIHQGEISSFERFRDQDKAETLIGLLTGQMLAASLLDWHLGEYFDEVSRIEAAVDKLDERVLRETSNKPLLGRMVALRRRVSKLRALLVPQRDVFYGLSRPDFSLVTDSGAAPFYEALAQRFERAVDEVERSRSVVVGSFDLFTSRTSQQTNDLVKVLTFLTAIVGFCAAIAGLMGMNFKLAFFDTGLTGFSLVTGALIVTAALAVGYARHREWI